MQLGDYSKNQTCELSPGVKGLGTKETRGRKSDKRLNVGSVAARTLYSEFTATWDRAGKE